MPGYHYVDRKLDVTNHNKDYTSVEQRTQTCGRLTFFQGQIKAEIRSDVKNVDFDFSLEK